MREAGRIGYPVFRPILVTLKADGPGNEVLTLTTGKFSAQFPESNNHHFETDFYVSIVSPRSLIFISSLLNQVETRRPLPGPLSEREKKFFG